MKQPVLRRAKRIKDGYHREAIYRLAHNLLGDEMTNAAGINLANEILCNFENTSFLDPKVVVRLVCMDVCKPSKTSFMEKVVKKGGLGTDLVNFMQVVDDTAARNSISDHSSVLFDELFDAHVGRFGRCYFYVTMADFFVLLLTTKRDCMHHLKRVTDIMIANGSDKTSETDRLSSSSVYCDLPIRSYISETLQKKEVQEHGIHEQVQRLISARMEVLKNIKKPAAWSACMPACSMPNNPTITRFLRRSGPSLMYGNFTDAKKADEFVDKFRQRFKDEKPKVIAFGEQKPRSRG